MNVNELEEYVKELVNEYGTFENWALELGRSVECRTKCPLFDADMCGLACACILHLIEAFENSK